MLLGNLSPVYVSSAQTVGRTGHVVQLPEPVRGARDGHRGRHSLREGARPSSRAAFSPAAHRARNMVCCVAIKSPRTRTAMQARHSSASAWSCASCSRSCRTRPARRHYSQLKHSE
jgi:hypothetical protein